MSSSSYLERYERGEHEQVWDELVALGAAVRKEPLYADAQAVARETMRRARANVLTLIQRLGRIGYLFGYAFLQPPAYLPLGRYERAWLHMSLAWAHEQPPLLGESVAELEEAIAGLRTGIERMRQHGRPGVAELAAKQVERLQGRLTDLETEVDKQVRALDAFEREVGALPLSLRAWYEAVGGVNFVGLHVGWQRLLDPADEDARQREEFVRGDVGIPFHRLAGLRLLCVPALEARRATQDPNRPGSWRYELMPDPWSLYGNLGTSTPCTLDLPCPGADGVLLLNGQETTTFVGYLRQCFRWGGFPGWEKAAELPGQDLAYLTEGLLPL
jgi:hypothetical protein